MLNNNEKISVIMAVYNCEDTVSAAIESIVNQTYTNWELIICNDCSTDSTCEVVKEYVEKYADKIVLIENKENSKLPYSLNHCLKYAKGKYVARMDGDDISMPDRFEKQINYLKSHNDIDLVGTAMSVFNGKEIIGNVVKPEKVDKYSLVTTPCFCHATIMTYKYVYDKLGGYSLDKRNLRVEDVNLWFRFFAAGFNGANISEELYRVTDDESAYKRRKFKQRFNAMHTLYDGYKLLQYPIKYYPLVWLPVLKGLVPKFAYSYFRNKKFK